MAKKKKNDEGALSGALMLIPEQVMEALPPALYVVGGGVSAMAGGALAEALIPGVEDWTSDDEDDLPWRGALVDLAGGTVLNGIITAGIWAWKGPDAAKVAGLSLQVGTVAEAVLVASRPKVDEYVDMGVDYVAELFGMEGGAGGALGAGDRAAYQLPAGSADVVGEDERRFNLVPDTI